MKKLSLSEQTRECAEYILEAPSVVVLSGAGLSTNAGIPDFRGPRGIYRRLDIPEPGKIFERDFFDEDPSLFFRFYRDFLKELLEISPTYTHFFLAALEQKGKVEGIITQNIDSLHQKAGSHKVYEIHGGVHQTHCTSCHKEYSLPEATKKIMDEEIPRCFRCNGVLKPDIVFFGESVKNLGFCEKLAEKSDLFFVLGSSLTVIPAAFLPGLCRGKVVVVNQGKFSTPYLEPQKISLLVDADLDFFFQEVHRELQNRGLSLEIRDNVRSSKNT